MKYHSQNFEDRFVHQYFGNKKISLLEIGANEGRTLSNSLFFIENDLITQAHLIEPGQTFKQLSALHAGNDKVKCYNYAIGGEFAKELTFYESGAHVIGGSDVGLVSTLDFEETERWRKAGVQFTETKVPVKTFAEFWKEAGDPQLDYVSIDCEGFDFLILQQIDLKLVGCRCLCIEWNGDGSLADNITKYANIAGLKIVHMNRENLIFTK